MPSLVALVMTVHNRENYLKCALDSILLQTYPHWHLTIWDDGSTDTSPDIAHEYAKLDPRIRFIQANHAGQTHSLHAAMMAIRPCLVLPNLNAEETSAQSVAGSPSSSVPTSAKPCLDALNLEGMCNYFGWVDSDDILTPDALATTVAILDEKPEIGMVYTDHRLIDPSGRDLGIGPRCHIPYSKERLLIDFMTFHFRLIRWELYDAVGGIDLEIPHVQDYDLCLKLSEVTEIYHHQAALYSYRVHPTMISSTQKAQLNAGTAIAVRNALVRRGLSERYRLDVTPDARFKLVPCLPDPTNLPKI
ncbi:glycosyltransferase [Chamaesiphon sp. OTE_20_metabat_361]|uniref:glycosyltransferase n=1 Tax=Chamaesiphon sp. OTE_20_metabat_361 TaxID=2964689 RepID=UPI00286CCD9A|nr:glycosyltransferase [Chamaesiphon sp. OTE_20_metabat_361]